MISRNIVLNPMGKLKYTNRIPNKQLIGVHKLLFERNRKRYRERLVYIYMKVLKVIQCGITCSTVCKTKSLTIWVNLKLGKICYIVLLKLLLT